MEVAAAPCVACGDCSDGQFSGGYNAATCSVCTNGRFATAAATECTDCAIGQYHATTGADCSDCEAGKIAAIVAQTSCEHCPSGRFQDAAVYHVCDECAAGTWTGDALGATECVAVPTAAPTQTQTPGTIRFVAGGNLTMNGARPTCADLCTAHGEYSIDWDSVKEQQDACIAAAGSLGHSTAFVATAR